MPRRGPDPGHLSLLAVAGLAVTVLLPPVAAPAGQNLSGLDVFRSQCDGCHELPDPEQPKRDRKEWEGVLNKMVKEKGASLSRQEFTAVLNYLDSFNQPRREVHWVDGPATSHKLAIDEKLVGRFPDGWVSMTTGSQADRPWIVKKDAASKSCFLTPSGTVGDSQQQLLLDNAGIVQAASVTTRLRIQSTSPARPGAATGAGIVFGYRSIDSYFGVRVSPSAKNLILYDVDPDQRALLGRATVAVVPGQWITLGVAVTAAQVKISLNGKPALTRPLSGYKGGHVGLATDGDTVAGFDQWTVDVKG